MALFGIGGNKSESDSVSKSQSTDLSLESSFGKSSQSIAFQDLFARLFGGAEGAAATVAGNLPTFTGEAASLFSGGMDFLGTLQEGGIGQDYLTKRLGGSGDEILQSQISDLGSDLGSFFREELLPGISSNAIAAGTFGGGRQGVAQGKAAEAVLKEFQRGTTSLRAADQGAKDAAALNLESLRSGNAIAGLGALPSLLGIAEAGATADFLPISLLASILGNPTTLTESLSGSQGYSYGQSTSKSKGSSSSGGFSFGLG